MFAPDSLETALTLVGSLLADRGETVEIVVVGGGALLLTGVIVRPTKDVDTIAVVRDGEYFLARPLPTALRTAVVDVAALLELDDGWLNPGPTDQLKMGLPEGFAARTTRRDFGGLIVYIAGRFDQICLKLYAAADGAPRGKHVADLRDLAPTAAEWARAAVWVKHQDASSEFARFVDAVIAHVGAVDGAR